MRVVEEMRVVEGPDPESRVVGEEEAQSRVVEEGEEERGEGDHAEGMVVDEKEEETRAMQEKCSVTEEEKGDAGEVLGDGGGIEESKMKEEEDRVRKGDGEGSQEPVGTLGNPSAPLTTVPAQAPPTAVQEENQASARDTPAFARA